MKRPPTTHMDRYLDYVNNFLTVERFADYYSMTVDEAQKLIDEAKAFIELNY